MRKTREMFGKLNISDFYQLYKEFDIWTNEVSRFRIYMRVQLNQLIAHSTKFINGSTNQQINKSVTILHPPESIWLSWESLCSWDSTFLMHSR